MTATQIVTFGDAAGFMLTPEILQQIGVRPGDQFELEVNGRAVIVRPVNDTERARKIATATRDIFDRRREAYLELAQGPE